MGAQWLNACGQVDAETTGKNPEAQLPGVWGKVKTGFAQYIEGRLTELKEFGVAKPEDTVAKPEELQEYV